MNNNIRKTHPSPPVHRLTKYTFGLLVHVFVDEVISTNDPAGIEFTECVLAQLNVKLGHHFLDSLILQLSEAGKRLRQPATVNISHLGQLTLIEEAAQRPNKNSD